ncbi:MAG: SCO family protein [Myxococcota bacterium]
MLLVGLLAALALNLALGCGRGEDGGPGVYAAKGIVEDVDREGSQVLIDHEEIDGLMPAMTMNFAVPDSGVLKRMSPGQVIAFELRFTGRSYEVEDFEIVGEAPAEAGWRKLGEGLVRSSPAPPFELVDQEGRTLSLASLGDLVLLVDFIYTACPGPCPVQTSNQVAVQKRIPAALREHIRFVSITLDPANDGPEELKAYAEARGADLSGWSFLSGPEQLVADLVLSWGVGSVRTADGAIDHTLITFLVENGRVMQRYTARGGGDEALLADVISLAEARAARIAQGAAPTS